MNTALDYGKLQRPDRKDIPKVNENPVQAVTAAYMHWEPVFVQILEQEIKEGKKRHFLSLTPDSREDAMTTTYATLEQCYNEALQVLSVMKEEVDDLKQADLHNFLQNTPGIPGAIGFFASILLNQSQIALMDGTFNLPIFGYKLAVGKRIIAREGSYIERLADIPSGDVVNLGKCGVMSNYADSGTHINFGDIDGPLCSYSTGSVVFNFGTCTGTGGNLENSRAVNYGNMTVLLGGHTRKTTLCINLGKTETFVVVEPGSNINLGQVKNDGTFRANVECGDGHNYYLDDWLKRDKAAANYLKKTVRLFFRPVELAATLDEKISAIEALAWPKLEERIKGTYRRMGKQI